MEPNFRAHLLIVVSYVTVITSVISYKTSFLFLSLELQAAFEIHTLSLNLVAI